MSLCPKCQGESSVVDSRASVAGLRRRRKCQSCEFRWSTVEVDVEAFKSALKGLNKLLGVDMRSVPKSEKRATVASREKSASERRRVYANRAARQEALHG